MKKGSILLVVLIFISAFSCLAVITFKIVYNSYLTAASLGESEQSFWLAQAGVAWGEQKKKESSSWYTDLLHAPADDREWLANQAQGLELNLLGEQVKVVQEESADRFYAIGRKKLALVVIKVDRLSGRQERI